MSLSNFTRAVDYDSMKSTRVAGMWQNPQMPDGVSRESELRRELGLGDLVLTQILFIVGLPWIGVAAKLGPSHVVLWLLAIVTFYIPCAMVVIWLNTRVPHEGGIYQWTKLGFNNFTGFMVAWNLWLYVIVLSSETGLQITTNLAYVLGPGHESLAADKTVITIISAVVIAILVWVSIAGLGIGKWFHNAGGFMLVVIFGAIVFFGMRSPGFQPWHPVLPALTLFNVNILSKMGFGALGGFEYVAILAGECRNPVQSIRRSVLIAAPVVAAMFILGTASVLALVPMNQIDLIGPVAQVLSIGAKPFGLASQVIPIAIIAVMILRVAQSSVNFTGNTRLPMVAGWDRLLPQWFTELHPRFRTPVNSILLAGALILTLGLVSLIGVGHQESFQLLWNGAVVFYAIPYVVMFLVPIFSRKLGRASAWIRIAACSALVMTLMNIFFSTVPIIQVNSSLVFTLKIAGVAVAGNLIGAAFYCLRTTTRPLSPKSDSYRPLPE
jgi:glutamate:GABA antiporter